MNKPILATHEQVRVLLELPVEAKAEDVFDCVVGCLMEELGCQFITPSPKPGDATRFQAAWLAQDGTRYDGEGTSDREAAMAAAVRLISQAEEAAVLRDYREPELEMFCPRGTQPRGMRRARKPAPVQFKFRRAGGPE